MRPMVYAHAIKMLREDNGLTQGEFAKKLGKAQTTVSSWEVGRTKPSPADLININKIFNTSIKPQYDYVIYNEKGDSFNVEIANELEEWTVPLSSAESSVDRNADIRLLTYLDQLNPDGIKEALKRVAELTEIPRYKKGAANGNSKETR